MIIVILVLIFNTVELEKQDEKVLYGKKVNFIDRSCLTDYTICMVMI